MTSEHGVVIFEGNNLHWNSKIPTEHLGLVCHFRHKGLRKQLLIRSVGVDSALSPFHLKTGTYSLQKMSFVVW